MPKHVALHLESSKFEENNEIDLVRIIKKQISFIVEKLCIENITLIISADFPSNLIQILNELKQVSVVLQNSGRREILGAAKSLVLSKVNGTLNGASVDESMFSQFLTTNGTSDPDLIVMTDGVLRVRNTLLWQMAYSEFWVIDKPWHELDQSDFLSAIESYQKRERRFGQVLNTI